jgi:uracil-DNA glycosylase
MDFRKMTNDQLHSLQENIDSCRLCESSLPHLPRPLFKLTSETRLLIIGQAPSRKAHETGIPWNDPSGERLRSWLGVTRTVFYEDQRIGVLPMGLCYPGTGSSGDLPPRSECAPLWHPQALQQLHHLEKVLLIGKYAQNYYLGTKNKTLQETLQLWDNDIALYLPLPHPSPRNNRWLKQNLWFENSILPKLKSSVQSILR